MPRATLRKRASTVTAERVSRSPDADRPPKQKRGTLSFLFPPRPERTRSNTRIDPSDASSTLPRRRTFSRPSVARSLTLKSRSLSRAESPARTLPSIFASLPPRARDTIRSSYDTARRSTSTDPRPADPETPSTNPHSFRLSEDNSPTFPRHSMASFARSPITGSQRRVSALALGSRDDLFDSAYRASTADLSDFLRATGPEDLHRRPLPPSQRATPVKQHDRDGANSVRSRTKSSLFRIGGRKREKSRPSIGHGISSKDPLPPVPFLPSDLPDLLLPQEQNNAKGTFSQILPILGLNDEGSDRGSTGSSLPPNTREHRLADGTTILMITTPQSEAKTLSHSRSLQSITALVKEEPRRPSLIGSNSTVRPGAAFARPADPSVMSRSTAKTHSPHASISSDGTLSTAEHPREIDVLLRSQYMLPPTPLTARAVNGHASVSNLQNGFLQAHVPLRPRGYSSPASMSTSPQSTPTIKTSVLTNFSPSASVASTPELTPQNNLAKLPEAVPVVHMDRPRKVSLLEPIVVDGLQFPAPPEDVLPARRRPSTVEVPRISQASTPRSSKSLRHANGPQANDGSPKDRSKRAEFGVRPRPLNLTNIPTWREWKNTTPEVQTQPGELTGLELDLNEGVTEPEKKRDSLMYQHQQMFLNANPFQTPPTPSDAFSAPGAVVPPLAGGPPPMPLPPSPSLRSQLPHSPTSTLSVRTVDVRRSSTPRRRSRVDSAATQRFPSPVPRSPLSPLQTLSGHLSAQREHFDEMSKSLVDAVKSFEQDKHALEMRVQELSALVAEKDIKAKEDERKIQGLEWLVANLNLRAAKNNPMAGATDASDNALAMIRRRRSSFAGLGVNEDVPLTPLSIECALDADQRARRADHVFKDLGALGLAPPNIYEWAANTVLERD